MEILKLENIIKEYINGEKKLLALNNLSLTVNRGEFVSIVGQVAVESQLFCILLED